MSVRRSSIRRSKTRTSRPEATHTRRSSEAASLSSPTSRLTGWSRSRPRLTRRTLGACQRASCFCARMHALVQPPRACYLIRMLSCVCFGPLHVASRSCVLPCCAADADGAVPRRYNNVQRTQACRPAQRPRDESRFTTRPTSLESYKPIPSFARAPSPIYPKGNGLMSADVPSNFETTFRQSYVKHSVQPYKPPTKPSNAWIPPE